MQEYWEIYMKMLEGHKAMVSFNASVADDLPDMGLGYVGFVKVSLKYPTPEGLVSDEEKEIIGFMEDSLEMESLRYRIGSYVGRIVTNSEINFIYYLKYEFEWPDTVNAAMKKFDEYTFEMGSRADFEWEVYQKLLYPNVREWQLIQNHHTCDQLIEAGDNLHLERAIEHKMFFENREDLKEFSEYILTEGFNVQKEIDPSDNVPLHGLQFYRVDRPHYYEIDVLTLALIEESAKYNAQYDGWETSLVKS